MAKAQSSLIVYECMDFPSNIQANRKVSIWDQNVFVAMRNSSNFNGTTIYCKAPFVAHTQLWMCIFIFVNLIFQTISNCDRMEKERIFTCIFNRKNFRFFVGSIYLSLNFFCLHFTTTTTSNWTIWYQWTYDHAMNIIRCRQIYRLL